LNPGRWLSWRPFFFVEVFLSRKKKVA